MVDSCTNEKLLSGEEDSAIGQLWTGVLKEEASTINGKFTLIIRQNKDGNFPLYFALSCNVPRVYR